MAAARDSAPGRCVVFTRALLDVAHRHGLTAIRTTLRQVPCESNGLTAIVAAEVETERSTFSGIGDASPAADRGSVPPLVTRRRVHCRPGESRSSRPRRMTLRAPVLPRLTPRTPARAAEPDRKTPRLW
jgi:hypothetical protein